MPTSADQADTAPAGDGLRGDVFVLAERTLFGGISQELIITIERLPEGLPIELEPGDRTEDRSNGTAAVAVLPLSRISDGVDGFYLLSIRTAGTEPLVIRRMGWQVTGSSATLEIETRPDGPIEARWGYSLRPRMRSVFLADDDGALGVDGSVLHVADFGPGPVSPDSEQLADGWIRSTFVTPLWLIDQTPLAEACERVLGELTALAGTGDLEWQADRVDAGLLEDAAVAVEQLLGGGQQVNLTFESGGQEIVRGKRLQPFVRYPVTVVDGGQNPTAATLGCSISPI